MYKISLLISQFRYYLHLLSYLYKTDSPVVKICSGNFKQPFFCVPGVVGSPLYLYDLACNFCSDYSFYGLQALGLDGKSKSHSKIEDMAAYYIRAIKAIQPQGPYLLGGHSFGARVAFEIAQQLVDQGLEVPFLAIIDSVAPVTGFKAVGDNLDDTEILIFFASLIEDWTGYKLNKSYDYLHSLDSGSKLTIIECWIRSINPLLPIVAQKQIRGLWQVLKTSIRINYEPKGLYPNKIDLFRVSEFPSINIENDEFNKSINNPTLGWNKLSAEPVEVHTIPGNHVTLMSKPHVKILAEQLKICVKNIYDNKYKDVM